MTNDEVKNLLCDGCRLGVNDSSMACSGSSEIDLDTKFTHYINGVYVPCYASRFRVLVARKAVE